MAPAPAACRHKFSKVLVGIFHSKHTGVLTIQVLPAIFLVIVQATAGPAQAVEAASPIFAAALQMGACSLSYALAAQILGFVRRSEEASRMETQRQQLEAQQQDVSAWFSFASIYGSVDEAGSTRDSTRDERKPRARAPLPLPEPSRAALAAHVASLLATCNLRALSVLITALGNDVVLAAVPPYSFPLPALVPPRPPLTQDCEASLYETRTVGVGGGGGGGGGSLYETRTVGVAAPRSQEGHGQLSVALTLAASATPRASATPPVVALVRASEREGCSPNQPPGPQSLPSNEYRLQLMFVSLLLLLRDRECV